MGTRAFIGLGLAAVCGLTIAVAQPAAQPAGQPAGEQPKAPETKPEAKPDIKPDAKPAVTPEAKPAASTSPIFGMIDGKAEVKPVGTQAITLLIEDLVIGEGKEANAQSTVTIHYAGKLKDGFIFDQTRNADGTPKEPATFPLPRLIQGWQLGIPGMKVGGVRKLTIPYQFAYGDRDVGMRPEGKPLIPAKSDLTFFIELKDVK